MSNLSLCDLDNEVNLLKVQDTFPNTKCKCQKQLTFIPNQFQLEGAGFRNETKKKYIETEKTRITFVKPGLKKTSPVPSAGVAANQILDLLKLLHIFQNQ